jgi:hypothetical protein
MKLTQKSQSLIPYFYTEESEKSSSVERKKLPLILEELHQDFCKAHDYVQTIQKTIGPEFYQITVKKITSIYHIPRPQHFNAHSFPHLIRKHIDEMSLTEIAYSFSLFGRKIKIYFVTEEQDHLISISQYNQYMENILLWLWIVNEYASQKCSLHFTVYFYFTTLEKHLPRSNIEILDENHVNTAFTRTCPRDSEIIVYRKEEWFKVFIHETFHNFGLDFSNMNMHECKQSILSLFPVKSEVHLYEAYTEFWAEIMNACFCSFLLLKEKKDLGLFRKSFTSFIDLERKYSFFQMVKTLDFMGLRYKDLYSTHGKSSVLRSTLYKERTNVLSYYVIKTILLHHYPLFLQWCKKHNLSLISFKKTYSNLDDFCRFIEKHYKSDSMLSWIKETEYYLSLLKKNPMDSEEKYLLSNMRMTICELG